MLGCHAASDISDHDPGMACDQMISGDFIPSRKQISVDSGNNTSMFWHERLLVGAPSCGSAFRRDIRRESRLKPLLHTGFRTYNPDQ